MKKTKTVKAWGIKVKDEGLLPYACKDETMARTMWQRSIDWNRADVVRISIREIKK